MEEKVQKSVLFKYMRNTFTFNMLLQRRGMGAYAQLAIVIFVFIILAVVWEPLGTFIMEIISLFTGGGS